MSSAGGGLGFILSVGRSGLAFRVFHRNAFQKSVEFILA